MPSQVTVSTRALLVAVLGIITVLAAYMIGHHNAASGNYGGYYSHPYSTPYYHSYNNYYHKH